MGIGERWAEHLARLSLRTMAAVLAAFFVVLGILSAIAALAWWLRSVWPGWAVWLTLSGLFLLLAVIGFAWGQVIGHGRNGRPLSSPGDLSAPAAGDPRLAIALALGESVGAAARTRPKAALAIALGVGVVLGASPSLRRELMALAGLGSGDTASGGGKKDAQGPEGS